MFNYNILKNPQHAEYTSGKIPTNAEEIKPRLFVVNINQKLEGFHVHLVKKIMADVFVLKEMP